MFSQCRQINRCNNIVGEEVIGSLGTSNCKDRWELKKGEVWQYREKQPSGYRLEHENLIASIRAGEPINEAQAIAESTMTAIIGREAAYSGQEIVWDEAMKSEVKLGPETYDVDRYAIPFFFDPRVDTVVEALPSCVSADHPARYEPMLYRDHLTSFMQRGYAATRPS